MAYFSNGTEGMMYEEEWCSRCVHCDGCAVWGLHMLYNYDECNNDNSMLHQLIPREGIHNGQCRMFIESQ